jgi:hypothetical protein
MAQNGAAPFVHQAHRLVSGTHKEAALARTGDALGDLNLRLDRALQSVIHRVRDDSDDFGRWIRNLVGKIVQVGRAHRATHGFSERIILERQSGCATGIRDCLSCGNTLASTSAFDY